MSKNSIYRVQSIERAFLILEEISRRKSGVRVTDLAADLSIPLPTVHRIVSFLEHKGYLEQDPETKRYHLGLKILELQGLFINRFSLVDRALPELKRIAYGLGETVHLGVLSDGYVVYIESLEGANSMISKATIGSRAPRPLHRPRKSPSSLAVLERGSGHPAHQGYGERHSQHHRQ